MALQIVDTEEETPNRVASVIIRENHLAWQVKCEGRGCGNIISVAKRTYRPVDYNNPGGPHVQTNYTAPGARICVACGPLPR